MNTSFFYELLIFFSIFSCVLNLESVSRQILKLIKKRENLKKELLKFTLETFEKRYRASDYDGTICESIKQTLYPIPNNQLNTNTCNQHNSALLHKSGQSSIDRTIANIIGSNKLGSPHIKVTGFVYDFLI